jgi:hypothetical protein
VSAGSPNQYIIHPETKMWKILVAFIIFAAISLTLIFNMGDKVDMQGEAGHGLPHSEESAPEAAPAAPAEASAEGESK